MTGDSHLLLYHNEGNAVGVVFFLDLQSNGRGSREETGEKIRVVCCPKGIRDQPDLVAGRTPAKQRAGFQLNSRLQCVEVLMRN